MRTLVSLTVGALIFFASFVLQAGDLNFAPIVGGKRVIVYSWDGTNVVQFAVVDVKAGEPIAVKTPADGVPFYLAVARVGANGATDTRYTRWVFSPNANKKLAAKMKGLYWTPDMVAAKKRALWDGLEATKPAPLTAADAGGTRRFEEQGSN